MKFCCQWLTIESTPSCITKPSPYSDYVYWHREGRRSFQQINSLLTWYLAQVITSQVWFPTGTILNIFTMYGTNDGSEYSESSKKLSLFSMHSMYMYTQ